VPRGKPLTPDEIERASEVWHRTGNYSEAARAIGAADPSTVRQALLRHEDTKRHQLHARACERGIRAARRAIAYGLTKARERFDQAADGSEFASVMKAGADAAKTLTMLAAQADERKAAKLARRKARAEIAAMQQTKPGEVAARLILPDFLFRREAEAEADAGQALPPEREAGTLPPRSS
jgi:hypothetical protein